MTYDELPFLMADLRADDAVAARALEFLVLTVARPGEVLGATRDEVDLIAAVWRIAGDRRKTGVGREVALCGRTIDILRDRATASAGPSVFADAQGGMPDERLLERSLLRLGRAGVTVHSFRSAFLDWAKRDGAPQVAAMAALGYAGEGEAERPGEQRELIERWVAFCLSRQVAPLVPAEPA